MIIHGENKSSIKTAVGTLAVEVPENEKPTFKRDLVPHRRTSYRICKDCGKMYVLSDSDAVFYIQKYGSLPLRCERCRERKYENFQEKSSSDAVGQ